ncbi:hypothetical protein ACR34G_00955 [Mycoplasma sp. 480]|uniref:hypothetical protein n=1 Tax=Mycoplasma sp. 480 TaxID=3440155 RepID=UPI003F512347
MQTINLKEKFKNLKNFSIINLVLSFSGIILFIVGLVIAAGTVEKSKVAAEVALVGTTLIMSIVTMIANIVILILTILGFTNALQVKNATNGLNKKYFIIWLSAMILIITNGFISFIPVVGQILGIIFSFWPIIVYILTIIWLKEMKKK